VKEMWGGGGGGSTESQDVRVSVYSEILLGQFGRGLLNS